MVKLFPYKVIFLKSEIDNKIVNDEMTFSPEHYLLTLFWDIIETLSRDTYVLNNFELTQISLSKVL